MRFVTYPIHLILSDSALPQYFRFKFFPGILWSDFSMFYHAEFRINTFKYFFLSSQKALQKSKIWMNTFISGWFNLSIVLTPILYFFVCLSIRITVFFQIFILYFFYNFIFCKRIKSVVYLNLKGGVDMSQYKTGQKTRQRSIYVY